MDENQDDSYATRRADLDAQFQALPPVGSPAYWQRIEEHNVANRLPLEVLARCCRECQHAGALDAAERIFVTILERAQPRLAQWSRYIAGQARSGMKPQLQEELEQESRLKLWTEVIGDGPTFLLERFEHSLDLLCKKVAHTVMEQAGEWTRSGVKRPTRVPRRETESIEAEPKGEGELSLAARLEDRHSQGDFERADLSDLYALIRKLPADKQKIVLDTFFRDKTQEETATELGITSRAVRYRLTAILEDLRRKYQGGEEVHNV